MCTVFFPSQKALYWWILYPKIKPPTSMLKMRHYKSCDLPLKTRDDTWLVMVSFCCIINIWHCQITWDKIHMSWLFYLAWSCLILKFFTTWFTSINVSTVRLKVRIIHHSTNISIGVFSCRQAVYFIFNGFKMKRSYECRNNFRQKRNLFRQIEQKYLSSDLSLISRIPLWINCMRVQKHMHEKP